MLTDYAIRLPRHCKFVDQKMAAESTPKEASGKTKARAPAAPPKRIDNSNPKGCRANRPGRWSILPKCALSSPFCLMRFALIRTRLGQNTSGAKISWASPGGTQQAAGTQTPKATSSKDAAAASKARRQKEDADPFRSRSTGGTRLEDSVCEPNDNGKPGWISYMLWNAAYGRVGMRKIADAMKSSLS